MTVAATTPVAADSSAPTVITVSASPPRSRPMSRPMVVRRRSASPDFSNTAPMNTKNGIASRIGSDIDPNHRWVRKRRSVPSKTPNATPSAAKATLVPAKQ